MELQMRKALKEATWKRYRKASRSMKTKILDELCAATGYHRQYAIAQLNLMEDVEPSFPKIPRTRKRHYPKDVIAVIEKVWEQADYPWSVRSRSRHRFGKSAGCTYSPSIASSPSHLLFHSICYRSAQPGRPFRSPPVRAQVPARNKPAGQGWH
jgi:hypothetical protein